MPKKEMTKEQYEAEIRKEILQNAGSFEHFSQHLRIVDRDGAKLIPFKLNPVQKLILEIRDDVIKRGLLMRFVILKGRRMGFSTLIEALFYWKTSTRPSFQALTLAHEPEASDTLWQMVKRFYNNMVAEFKPSTRFNNKRLLDFNTQDGKGLDSLFKLGTAGKGDYGSAQLNHCLHISEAAKIKQHIAAPLFTSLFQTVTKDPETEVYVESTAKGAGGEFYSMYQKSRYDYEIYLKDGVPTWRVTINKNAIAENRWIRVFIPWFADPKYTMPVDASFERIGPTSDPALLKRYDDEEYLATTHGLTDGQLMWRRVTIQTECQGVNEEQSLSNFHAEYPSNAREAFITTGDNVFDNQKIDKLMDLAPEPKVCYNCSWGTGIFVAEQHGPFQVWEEPKPGQTYIVSADISEGLVKGDFTSIDVINFLTGEQVAHMHGKWDPDVVGYILADIGNRYNGAWVVPELNNHGHVVVALLTKIIKYPRVFINTKAASSSRGGVRYGWMTTQANKPQMIDNLIKELRDDEIGIRCKETFGEMLNFVQHTDGTLGAQDSAEAFDDRVMSLAIAKYVRRFLPLPSSFKVPQTVTELQEMNRVGGINGGSEPLPGAYW